MSVEAASRRYLFIPDTDVPKVAMTYTLDDETMPEPTAGRAPDTSSAPPKWRHNVLHDLESIWWVALWAAFTFRPAGVTPEERDEAHFSNLFTGPLKNLDRRDMLTDKRMFTRLKNQISYNKDVFERLGLCLTDIRTAFKNFEAFSTLGDAEEAPLVPEKLAWGAIRSVIAHLNNVLDLPNSGDDVTFGNPKSVERAQGE